MQEHTLILWLFVGYGTAEAAWYKSKQYKLWSHIDFGVIVLALLLFLGNPEQLTRALISFKSSVSSRKGRLSN